MASLYNLSEGYKEVLDKMDEGYSFEDIKDTLDAIKADMDTKVDNIIGLKRSAEGDVEIIDKEIKRLQTLKKQKLNLADKLKGYLQDMLEVQELDNYRTSKNYVFKKRNAPSKSVTDEKLIPDEYWLSQAPKLNAKQLTDDLKAGKEVPGAELKVTESLVIR
ncbi:MULTISPECIES: siphovirus Gp157 family protein [unclassified Staphylococcus]|uniref:siphovirus Gp157 family protein n=1 Tax=unclassified Staphylococcus TaxID=91994 RepID=UPI0008A877DB|nr:MULTISPECIES: siphovirus Gp157 family protein [unclassified Staphylococcus]OHR53279.1 siphovirus superfamily [Staphylococcus sp. HMSC070A03]OHR58319.1 siphovirus superfamily [Staphylococcus sp. HMSC070A02]